jgi:hypothetical protein
MAPNSDIVGTTTEILEWYERYNDDDEQMARKKCKGLGILEKQIGQPRCTSEGYFILLAENLLSVAALN